MKSAFDKHKISYECYDNSFTDISDVEKAQALADKFDSKKLCRHLDAFAKSINPFLDTVQKTFGQGYQWCVNQCEFATDVMFKEQSFLEDIYPSLVGHAFYDFTCTDVFTFMGRKPDPRFRGEAVSDYKDRPIGCRVKFKLKSNSIKMYNKCSVLRIETTINNPREFKVYATVHHNNGTESKEWKPMGKSISNLYRYAEVSKACNHRFIDAMVDIVPVESTLKEIGTVCTGKNVDGTVRLIAGLKPGQGEWVDNDWKDSKNTNYLAFQGFQTSSTDGKSATETILTIDKEYRKNTSRENALLYSLDYDIHAGVSKNYRNEWYLPSRAELAFAQASDIASIYVSLNILPNGAECWTSSAEGDKVNTGTIHTDASANQTEAKYDINCYIIPFRQID